MKQYYDVARFDVRNFDSTLDSRYLVQAERAEHFQTGWDNTPAIVKVFVGEYAEDMKVWRTLTSYDSVAEALAAVLGMTGWREVGELLEQ